MLTLSHRSHNTITAIVILAYMVTFFAFGLYHIGKFETVDEHFWKYDRIAKYYKSWHTALHTHKLKDLRKTHINDKPGITLALVSGIGLTTDPLSHRIRTPEATANERYTVYDAARTEQINRAFRIPILALNTLLLPLLFYLFYRLLASRLLALLALSLIAFSPVLVGISQILNPDAFLWSFGSSALFAYLLLLKTGERKFLALTTLLTGLALLSKYTASILFLFYPMLFVLHLLTQPNTRALRSRLLRHLRDFAIIALGSMLLFALLMPAVFVKVKYLTYGTFASPAIGAFTPYLLGLIAVLLLDALLLDARLTRTARTFLRPALPWLLRASALLMLALVGAILFNAWSGQTLVSFHNIKETSYVEGALLFPQFAHDPAAIAFLKKLLVEVTPFVFAQLPLALVLLAAFYLIALLRPRCIARDDLWIALFFLPLPLLYAVGALGAGVFVNYRYMILLYPLFAYVIALGAKTLLRCSAWRTHRTIILIGLLILVKVNGTFALWQIKPFYFNYMNALLPRDMIVTDAWGYGSYEAAQFLNSLPNAENLVIWSDRSAVCQFFRGKCIRDYKIDPALTPPDYFVFSRRGMIRHQFLWRRDPAPYGYRPQPYYYAPATLAHAAWRLSIGGRRDNVVLVVKARE